MGCYALVAFWSIQWLMSTSTWTVETKHSYVSVVCWRLMMFLKESFFIIRQQSTKFSYCTMFIEGVAFDIDCDKPHDILESWQCMYSKKVVLVQWPAHWISIVVCQLMYTAIVPPTQREWELTSNLSKHAWSRLIAVTASFTTWLISLFWTCLQGRNWASLKAQISVLGMAPSCIS